MYPISLEIGTCPQESGHVSSTISPAAEAALPPPVRGRASQPRPWRRPCSAGAGGRQGRGRSVRGLAARPERRDKSEKDIKQAVYVGQYALTEKTEKARLQALWTGLPKKWKALIRRSLVKAKDMMPLDAGVIRGLLDLLR